MKYYSSIAALCVALLATGTYADEPPAALVDGPPVALVTPRIAKPEVEPVSAGMAACVFVNTVNGGGSGTCVASEGGKSLVLTNNHVVSSGRHPDTGWRDDVYPLVATVTHEKKQYTATAVSGVRNEDIALVVVDGTLPVALVAERAPAAGTKVYRNGSGSGYQVCQVIEPDMSWTQPSMHFVVKGISESGDSGAGYFDEKGLLVAVHCGKNTTDNPRGTPITSVRTVVLERTPVLFPRLRARLAARNTVIVVPVDPEPPAAIVATKPRTAVACSSCSTCGINCTCLGSGLYCADGRCPLSAGPVTGYAPTTAGTCSGPSCPVPATSTPLRYVLPGSSSSGTCSGPSCRPAPTRRGLFR